MLLIQICYRHHHHHHHEIAQKKPEEMNENELKFPDVGGEIKGKKLEFSYALSFTNDFLFLKMNSLILAFIKHLNFHEKILSYGWKGTSTAPLRGYIGCDNFFVTQCIIDYDVI